ncbi:hypothetical protein, partial [Caballeronia arvi]|uniref:hypothetical protein n=1 Tax=Caballeronia arvi TaxID=1777135 RepID=UPI001F389523
DDSADSRVKVGNRQAPHAAKQKPHPTKVGFLRWACDLLERPTRSFHHHFILSPTRLRPTQPAKILYKYTVKVIGHRMLKP